MFDTRLLHDGLFEEDGVIWAPDGTVLAQSRQLGIIMPTDKPVLQPVGSQRRADEAVAARQKPTDAGAVR